MQRRGQRRRAARLGHDLQMPERRAHRAAHIVITHPKTARKQPFPNRKSQLARLRRQDRIADRARARRVGEDRARLQRPRPVIMRLRLGRPDLRRRRQPLERQRDPRDQPAPARTADQGVKRLAAHRHLPRKFQPRRALPGDDVRVVIARHHHCAARRRKPLADLFAALGVAVEQHHFAAIRLDAGNLNLRSIRGHHDHRRHPHQPRRPRHALRMVAGRKRHHAGLAPLRRDLRQPVGCPAHLETAGHLKAFRLHEHLRARSRIDRAMRQHRRFAHVGVHALCRGAHVMVIRKNRLSRHARLFICPAPGHNRKSPRVSR